MGARSIRPSPSLDGSTVVHAGGNLYVDAVTGMVLSRVGYVHEQTGYEKVSVDGRVVSAHRVVWRAVHGEIPVGMTINHIDGDKTNNRIDNLELATQSEQVSHAYAIGLRVGNGLTGRRRARRLTDDDVRRLQEAPRGTITDLAAELGVSRSYAYQVRAGRRSALDR